MGLNVYTLRLVSGLSLGITMSNEGLVVRKLLKEASRAVQERVRVGDFCMALNGYVLNTSNKLREALRRVNSSFETHYEITFGRHRKVRVKDDVIITDSKEEEEEEEVKYLKQETEKSLREEHDRIEEEKERKKRNEIREKSSPPPPVTLPQPSSSNMKSISRNILSSLLSTKNENDLFKDHVVSKKKKPQSPDVVLNSADALKDLRDRIETAHDVQSEIEKFCAIVQFHVRPSIKILSVDWTHNADRSVLFNINVRIFETLLLLKHNIFGRTQVRITSKQWIVKHPYVVFEFVVFARIPLFYVPTASQDRSTIDTVTNCF